jgi:hypothetical protein
MRWFWRRSGRKADVSAVFEDQARRQIDRTQWLAETDQLTHRPPRRSKSQRNEEREDGAASAAVMFAPQSIAYRYIDSECDPANGRARPAPRIELKSGTLPGRGPQA